MQSGPGYWLDPGNAVLHEVTTHNDWLLVRENQLKVGLSPKQISVLASLDPVKQIDEIRMVGCRKGLIRIRDRWRNLTFQFDAPADRLKSVLQAIAETLPRLFNGPEHYLSLHNLHDDAQAELWTTEFTRRLQNEEPILTPRKEPIQQNEELRQQMDQLLSDTDH